MRAGGILQDLGELVAHRERSLGAAPDGQLAVAAVLGGSVLRLDVALVHGGRAELALDDHRRLAETGLHVAQAHLHMPGHVCGPVAAQAELVGAQIGVQDGRVSRHGLPHVEHRRAAARSGRRSAPALLRRCAGWWRPPRPPDGRSRGPGRAPAHSRAASGPRPGLNRHAALGRQVGEVGRGHHGRYAGQRGRTRRVDRQDGCVRVRAAQHRAVEHARQAHIGAVQRPACDFVGAGRVERTGADHPIGGRFRRWRAGDVRPACRRRFRACATGASIIAAASSTARTILS